MAILCLGKHGRLKKNITNQNSSLIEDIKLLNGWPERVQTMQKNWIGRSVGAEIKFKLADEVAHYITVFTTRADTLCGVSFIAIAPDNEVIYRITSEVYKQEIKNFREKISIFS